MTRAYSVRQEKEWHVEPVAVEVGEQRGESAGRRAPEKCTGACPLLPLILLCLQLLFSLPPSPPRRQVTFSDPSAAPVHRPLVHVCRLTCGIAFHPVCISDSGGKRSVRRVEVTRHDHWS